jgi:hypothetical protein
VVLVDHGMTTNGRTPSVEEAKARFLLNWQKCCAEIAAAPES